MHHESQSITRPCLRPSCGLWSLVLLDIFVTRTNVRNLGNIQSPTCRALKKRVHTRNTQKLGKMFR